MVPPADIRSYYGQPILKEPVWKWMIPAYFAAGGLAAGSAVLAFGARRAGNAPLARTGNLTATAAMAASAGLLVADLGRPERFANMLRVAKPTSPMSVGTWVITAFGPLTGVAMLCDLTGVAPTLGHAAEGAAAALAPIVATYTAVLLSDTAIPAWHEAADTLPFVFAAGAAASAGAVAATLIAPEHSGPARRLAVAAGAADVVAGAVMARRLGDFGEPYRHGPAARLASAASWCVGAGVALLALAGRRRAGARAGGALVAAGAFLERFAVIEAGRVSAREPRYTVAPQRARLVPTGAAGDVS
jgi:hypothetical protein